MDLIEAKKAEARHPWEQARVEVIHSLILKNIRGFAGKKRWILDLGCGDTYVAEQLSGKFPEAEILAVDTAFTPELLQAYSQSLKGKSVYVFDSMEAAYKQSGTTADLVLLMDVLEHVEDDQKLLKEILASPLSGPETIFLITVPAHQALFSSHDKFLVHYRRYSERGLRDTLQSAGLNILSQNSFFSSLIAPRSFQVLKEKILGEPKQTSTDVVEWKSNPFKEKIMKSVLLWDFHLSQNLNRVGIRLPGLSLYALCKKSAS